MPQIFDLWRRRGVAQRDWAAVVAAGQVQDEVGRVLVLVQPRGQRRRRRARLVRRGGGGGGGGWVGVLGV